jgi:biofilm PGA synthesis N-glycosyltransferase PgaC
VDLKYVLVTAARNEQAFIERTLESVIGQTRRPERWVIVDDGSTDGTASIVEAYARAHPWIELVRRPQRIERSFAGKAHAVNAAVERVRSLPFEVVGNLDADVSFEPDYLESVMRRFEEDPALGVAGTPFTQDGGYDSAKDSFEGEYYVAGPCQLFRRQCFDAIGGYVPNPAGGVDWIAVMTARMMGWKVRAFPDRRFHHHRSLGTAERGRVAAAFSYGEKDYYLGGSPVWQLFRGVYQMSQKPFVLCGMALLAGYFWAALRRVKRPVSDELVRFHRQNQMNKLKAVTLATLRLRRADSFSPAAERLSSK